MIIIAGVRSDDCLSLVANRLEERGKRYAWFDQLDRRASIDWEWSGSEQVGSMATDGHEFDLRDVRSVYMRLESIERTLRRDESLSDPRSDQFDLYWSFLRWIELTSARVVTRNLPQRSNASKPYQLQLIAACGFAVPETIVTNTPEVAVSFRRRHGKVIYKSASSVRSIVHLFESHDDHRLGSLKHCPVLFQQYVPGRDIRVHVIGDVVFSTSITSEAVDYRYARHLVGVAPTFERHTLPDDVADRAIRMTRRLGLDFAGIDFKLTDQGEYFCLEVNPMPGYAWFEKASGADISGAVASLLAAD